MEKLYTAVCDTVAPMCARGEIPKAGRFYVKGVAGWPVENRVGKRAKLGWEDGKLTYTSIKEATHSVCTREKNPEKVAIGQPGGLKGREKRAKGEGILTPQD